MRILIEEPSRESRGGRLSVASRNGKAFGSITKQEIMSALASDGINVDKNQIKDFPSIKMICLDLSSSANSFAPEGNLAVVMKIPL